MSDFSQHRPAPLTAKAAETLAATLVEEMIARWRQGERPLPEEYLARHPELANHPEAAADLIYEELCLRQEYGPAVTLEQLLDRFPQWRPQIEVLFDCQRVLGPCKAAPEFPAAGESFGDFFLLAELGRGAHGRVFLASQRVLGDRPVVLKVTPGDAHEHLSLARLQHTHIVPLYSVEEDPERGLRGLCMPYFGGATLAQLLEALRHIPPHERTGQHLVDALDQLQAEVPLVAPTRGTARRTLGRATYGEALCWIGACLADALHYAHERGLVHLDLKPSNVLLAADGQPMVLDFHLAREPIARQPDAQAKDPSVALRSNLTPYCLGGTPGYMSPEQAAAIQAIQQGRLAERPVDGRSDIYALGVVLYAALGGSDVKRRGLRRANPQVSLGLEDVIAKCLARDPDRRYPHMAALAGDLRRHLADLPLAGVRNRSMRERWHKWRRRRPHGVALAGMMLAVLTAAGAVALGAASYLNQRIDLARSALNDGRVQLKNEQWDSALRTLQAGLAVARGTPGQGELAEELAQSLHEAEQGQNAAQRAADAAELHRLADQIRFLYGTNSFPAGLRTLETCCRSFWDKRDQIARHLNDGKGGALDPAVRDDLLDLAIFWADLDVRLAPLAGKEEANQKALTVLTQAESLFGPSAVLGEERKRYAAALPDDSDGMLSRPSKVGKESRSLQAAKAWHPAVQVSDGTVRESTVPESSRPPTAWQHYALGRTLLGAGELDRAEAELAQAVKLEPQGLWPNFYKGLCAYRQGKYDDAVTAFSVCIGAAPEAACFFNRAQAYVALKRQKLALQDYDKALALDSTLTAAVLNRGMLHYDDHRYAAARTDLLRALELKANPAVVHFDMALVDLGLSNPAAARENLRRALGYNPDYPEARTLLDSLTSAARASH
jgi:serine/threonine protein kinase/Flp pilus assembly protein TadD